jgi:hypothetical protein
MLNSCLATNPSGKLAEPDQHDNGNGNERGQDCVSVKTGKTAPEQPGRWADPTRD